MRIKTRAAIAVVLALLVMAPATAVDYKAEFDKKIKAAQNIGVLGEGLAGDETNFYTGATTFKATDITVPGNAFDLTLSRSYDVDYEKMFASYLDENGEQVEDFALKAFGDWDLDVPRISGTFSLDEGWVLNSTTPEKRCSVIGQVNQWGNPANGTPPVSGTRMDLSAGKFWSGYTLHGPAGAQPMLVASLPNAERPSTGGPYHWTTNQNWWISCLPVTANNRGGEAFLAISPDGTQYTFNWMSRQIRNNVSETYTDPLGQKNWHRTSYVYRADYSMLPTLVVDRFGNWKKYEWSNDEFALLQRVSAGRLNSPTADQYIELYYAGGLVQSATDGTRTWRYEYSSFSLAKVILPDGSSWKYNFWGLITGAVEPYCDGDPNTSDWYWACFGGGEVMQNPVSGSVTHPSGARVDFIFDSHFQYSPSTASSYPLGLVQKTIVGAGLEDATWKLSFLPDKEAIKTLCQASACPVTRMTDMVAPDGGIVRRIFGLVSGRDQSIELGELRGALEANGGGSPAITQSARWGASILGQPALASGHAPAFYSEKNNFYLVSEISSDYTVRVGVNPLGSLTSGSQVFASERRLPVIAKTLAQQGVVFSTDLANFDLYARPQQVTRRSAGSSGGDASRTEFKTFYDNESLWVLGQVLSVKDVGTGRIVSATVYDGPTALPVRNSKFGVLQETIEYNVDGTVASVLDGRGKRTTVSDWYRGTPRKIVLADESSMQAVVNPSGTIASSKDALGYVTSYGYDLGDRLSRITYPTGDTTVWNDTLRNFVPVATGDEVPVGYWKQVTATGNGSSTTYYDAQWRPVLVRTEDTGDASSRSYVAKRFDAMGREEFVSYPMSSPPVAGATLLGVTTSFDGMGRPWRVQQDSELGLLTSTTEYLAGFRVKATNARQFSTTTSFQVFDQPDTSRPVRIEAPEGVITTITRDVFGKPTKVTRSDG